MSVNLITVVRDGYGYSKQWPLKSELYSAFPECRVIKATQFATLIIPLIVVVTFFTQYHYLGQSFIAQSIAMCCLMLSLPVQGYIWLGKRAKQLLPVSLASWYYQLEQKILSQGIDFKGIGHKPTYLDLANALAIAFKKLDKNWINDKL